MKKKNGIVAKGWVGNQREPVRQINVALTLQLEAMQNFERESRP